MDDSVQHCTDITIRPITPKVQNKSGRPVKSKNVQFGPQPPSIISQLLRKNVTNIVKHNNVTVEATNNIEDDKKVEETDYLCVICSLRYVLILNYYKLNVVLITNNLFCRMSDKKEYKKHLKGHKNYSCKYPECNYTTRLSSNLIKHKRKHTSEKPFLCDQCTFRTNFINSLKVHKRIHTEERPYACEHCSYKCNSSSNLKKHCHFRHLKTIS